MDILLTHAYFLEEDPTEKRIMRPYPPLGLLYLSSYLKEKGFDVTVFDSTFETMESLRAFLTEQQPPVVGIYVNLMTKVNALRLIRECKAVGAIVIVGGPEVPFYGEDFIRHGADIAVRGEGELALEEVLQHIQKNGAHRLEKVSGLFYRHDDGRIVRTPDRPLIPDLNVLPLPDRNAININKYIDLWREHHGMGSVSLICARGCPYTCTWCSRSVFGETHRRRSPTNVVDEIEMILDRYSPDMLWFADDVFTIHYRWLGEFHKEMQRRGLRIPFECISRADKLNDDILSTMSDLGCRKIWYGSESGSQRILDAMQRKVTVKQIRDATRLAKSHGIQTGLFVMLGYPGEEIADIDATIDHLVETAADDYLTTTAYPIKGTPFHESVKDRLIQPDAWEATTDRSLDFSGRHSRSFYWFATRHLTNEVRARNIRRNGDGNFLELFSAYARSRISRIGMLLTEHERT